ncbi:hypothetical protein [Sphingobacterium multivorum]|uniref:hypothetical protein n=1 Tax=Sphingobacterium multivorum TaxID=28454 RepID=UPI00142E4EC1|nr:hypothetical protein [Sphingobacterium multivorum]QQT43623.1 hypothetical protein I6J00_17965 [Sphingobacterium multivorum]
MHLDREGFNPMIAQEKIMKYIESLYDLADFFWTLFFFAAVNDLFFNNNAGKF